MPKPTKEQLAILAELSHCVVVAKPGSGKTFTLARKIEGILKELPDTKGVVAISYTNKASDELMTRTLAGGVPPCSTFFGTIDRFFITEVIAFLPHVLAQPPKKTRIVRLQDMGVATFDELLNSRRLELSQVEVDAISGLYEQGHLPLDLLGKLGVWVFDRSISCRRYLKARYTHIVIDEYQDSGYEQHQLFLRLKGLGITSIAVGDTDQSIYAFSRRSSEYLLALGGDRDFIPYPLTENHRCHESIVHYSLKLMNVNYGATPPSEQRVYDKHVLGNEVNVAAWLDKAIPKAKTAFGVLYNSGVAVLSRSNRTGDLISQKLEIPHKLFIGTPLDEDSSIWGGVFRRALTAIFDPGAAKFQMIEEYLSVDFNARTAKSCLAILRELQETAVNDESKLQNNIPKFEALAKLMFPLDTNATAIATLQKILADPELLSSFVPAKNTEVQLLSLHKSKGLEFDLVFHLDLHQWIMPGYKAVMGNADEYVQDLNLHYVGITRAKKATILCTSTKRTNKDGIVVDAEPSEFLFKNDLATLRKHL